MRIELFEHCGMLYCCTVEAGQTVLNAMGEAAQERIAVLDDCGAEVWAGALAEYAAANDLDADTLRRELHAEQAPAIVGGGAAPLFYVSLTD